MGFQGFFDEQANFPCPGTILGENIDVISVAADDDRRELVATCQRNGHRYEIALLDIDIQAERHVRLAAVPGRIHGRREVKLLELGEEAVDVGDVLAAEAPAAGDQLRKLAGGRLGVRAGSGVARVPQPAGGREDSEMLGAERL